MVRSLSRESLPKDIRAECFDGITEDERPEPGEWIAIWGGKMLTTFEEAILTKQGPPPPVVALFS